MQENNLLRGNFNNKENGERVSPHLEMLSKIWNIPTAEVEARLMREYEDAVKKEGKNLIELPEDVRKRTVHVLNQVLPAEEKLKESATAEEVLAAYRKSHAELQHFVHLSADEWKPTGDDKEDLAILNKRFSL